MDTPTCARRASAAMRVLALLLCVSGLSAVSGSSSLPAYTGPKPPWPYRGFESFPGHFFGANESGLENASRLELAARHQFAGWGWQQNYKTVGPNDGHYYQQEVSLAQMASRLAAYAQFAPPSPKRQLQAIFVYRHIEVAEFYFQVSAAAYHDQRNDEMFLRDKNGHVCWNTFDNTGPYWNFSSTRTADWFLDEIVGELTREADIQAVFFDETDYLYCGGPAGNCSMDMISADAWAAQYRDKIQLLRKMAQKLNKAGIWPIYSSYNGFSDSPYRKCILPFDEYYTALHDVGWFRFYEYGFGATKPDPSWNSQGQFAQALRESSLGLPVIVHPYPAGALPGGSVITLPLALFLLAQNEYWYFGASSGWVEKDWQWWSEYDKHYGRPLGPAKHVTTGSQPGWSRDFEACTVWASEDLRNATIVFKTGTTLMV